MSVIDIHTHMLNNEWVERLVAHGGNYSVRELRGQKAIHMGDTPFMTLMDPMFDYALRIRDMDEAGVDLAVVSLTCPSVYWGGEEVSSESARKMNDDMAAQQALYPDRIRWFATLPWQYAERAIAEIERAMDMGAAGIFVTANVSGRSLTDEALAPIWREIDKRALPVLVHPSIPQGADQLDLVRFNLTASVGFTFDTTLAISRMIYAGFIDAHPNLKLIACHAGGYLPFLVGRLDICYDNIPSCKEVITEPPSTYMDRIYYDSVTFTQEALDLCIIVAGSDNVLYGSDYPHNIGDMKGCLARVDSLAPDVRDKIRSKNAERIFGF